MTYFYMAFQQQLMGVKIQEQCRIEWYFEDVSKISIVEATANNNQELHWLWIQLNKPPMWTRKIDNSTRIRSSWDNTRTVRRNSPPVDVANFFTDIRSNAAQFGLMQDTISADGRNIHLAILPLRKTWETQFAYPVYLRLFENYDRTLVEQLRANGAPSKAPFANETWFEPDALCQNCDDGHTTATAHCITCNEHLCRPCDLVLHKSAIKSAHARRTLCVFPDNILKQRETTNPCTCERIRETQCPCQRLRLFCLLECKCQYPNLFNHGPHDELDADVANAPSAVGDNQNNNIEDEAPKNTISASVKPTTRPVRFGKKRRGTGPTKRDREDTSLRKFIKHGRVDDNFDEEEDEDDGDALLEMEDDE